MSTGPVGRRSRITSSRWFVPALSFALGLVMLAALWIGGHPVLGLWAVGVMTAQSMVLLFGGRSETIRGLRGDGRDERFAMIDMKATAIAGVVVLLAVIIAFLVAVAQGQDGKPYSWLAAINGLAYLIAIGILRWRS